MLNKVLKPSSRPPQSLSFPFILHSGGASLERLLMRTEDILRESGRSSVISAFCGMEEQEETVSGRSVLATQRRLAEPLTCSA